VPGSLQPALVFRSTTAANDMTDAVLLCVLVGARRTVGRVICFFAVMSVFVGQNLSKQVANLLIDVASVFGLRWTIVTDPSDLWALVSLPLAWWLVNEDGVRLCTARPKIERAMMFAGACAWLATSEPGDQDSFAEFVWDNGRIEEPEECNEGSIVPMKALYGFHRELT
jgi:hypothetical protein